MKNSLKAAGTTELVGALFSSAALAAVVPPVSVVSASSMGILVMASAAVTGAIWLARRK